VCGSHHEQARQVTPEKQHRFVSTLIDNAVPILCCMVNLIAFHPHKFQ
jgi:hypothetical protein